ncbi:MAG: winged helix-turn-helix transcriptional regulator [Ruminococcus sp.]|nr:winged helix-turn-helix transcriptional regulator [Ruminococcus sp.]
MSANKFVCIFKALGDSTRLQIVQMLSGGEMCACKILEQFEITQPTLSHHMKILCESEIVTVRKEGKWSYYSLSCEVFSEFQQFVSELKCCKEKI